jgi:hypothetical protein
MTGVGKKRAPKIVSEVARMEAPSRIYVMSPGKVNERQAVTPLWLSRCGFWRRCR